MYLRANNEVSRSVLAMVGETDRHTETDATERITSRIRWWRMQTAAASRIVRAISHHDTTIHSNNFNQQQLLLTTVYRAACV